MSANIAFIRPGFWEVMVILLVILVIFGAGKLPEVGKSLGEAIKGFKKSMKDEEKPKNEEKPTC